jgi:ribosomal protein S18 acetylase RimI-like enzyme
MFPHGWMFSRMNPSLDFPNLFIRPASVADSSAIWRVIEPTIRAGETWTLPPDLSEADALAYWFSPAHEVFVAESPGEIENRGEILGSYYLRPNQPGNGSHVANCGYMTAPWATGRSVARAMCAHSLDRARSRGFLSMQFNIVVSTNDRAVRLWQHMGFAIVGRLPEAFHHPTAGLVEAYVMHRKL